MKKQNTLQVWWHVNHAQNFSFNELETTEIIILLHSTNAMQQMQAYKEKIKGKKEDKKLISLYTMQKIISFPSLMLSYSCQLCHRNQCSKQPWPWTMWTIWHKGHTFAWPACLNKINLNKTMVGVLQRSAGCTCQFYSFPSMTAEKMWFAVTHGPETVVPIYDTSYIALFLPHKEAHIINQLQIFETESTDTLKLQYYTRDLQRKYIY